MTYFNKQFTTKSGFSGNGANLTNVNAASVTGFLPSQTNTASTIAVRDSAGALVVSTPTVANHAATKSYVDTAVSNVSGGGGATTPQSVNADIVTNETIATEGQTTFAVTGGFSTGDFIVVYFNGVLLSIADYTTNTPNIILNSGTMAGDVITTVVTRINNGTSNQVAVNISRFETTATVNQTTYTVSNGFTLDDKIVVYFNGVILSTTDYMLSSPDVVLYVGADAGDIVTIFVTRAAIGFAITIEEQTTDTPPTYLSFVDSTSGTATTLKTNTGLTYTPSTNTVNASNFNSTSDRRLKENIVPIQNALSVVEKLNGYEYDFKDYRNHASGVIAQELEQVLPFTVSEVGGFKTVSYNQLIPYLIEGIKQQTVLINNLQQQINELKENK